MIYGDTRTFPAVHDSVVEMIVSTYEEDPAFQSLIPSIGDIVDAGYCEAHWDEQIFDPRFTNIRQLYSQVPFQSCIGNHEYDGYIFGKYFPYPYISDFYWSFDYGPAHFAVHDQFIFDSTSAAEELEWLENDLASTNKPWKFIILHKPGWAAGHYENDMDVQTHIQPLCVQYGVAMVFAGHNHYYSHALVEGIQHVTTAGGGAPLYEPDPTYPNIMTAVMNYHFCKVEIDGNRLDLTAVALGDSIIDRFSLDLNSPVSVTNIIDSLPVIIPHSGGLLDFTVRVMNSSGSQQEFDLWTMLTLPDGSPFGPLSNIPDIIIPADTTFFFDFSETIGDTMPQGDYLHHSYAGIYSDSLYSEDTFEFEKLPSAQIEQEDRTVVIGFYLYPANPNPFNASTAISYQLLAVSHVNLTIYDITGREVAKLVDGMKPAVSHQVVFDAKDLTSGVYFARLEAGEFRQTRKMLLVK